MQSDDLMPEQFANAQVSMEALHAAQCVILLSLSTDTTIAELLETRSGRAVVRYTLTLPHVRVGACNGCKRPASSG